MAREKECTEEHKSAFHIWAPSPGFSSRRVSGRWREKSASAEVDLSTCCCQHIAADLSASGMFGDSTVCVCVSVLGCHFTLFTFFIFLDTYVQKYCSHIVCLFPSCRLGQWVEDQGYLCEINSRLSVATADTSCHYF